MRNYHRFAGLAVLALAVTACAVSPTGRRQLLLVSEDSAIVASQEAYAAQMRELRSEGKIEPESSRVSQRVKEITGRTAVLQTLKDIGYTISDPRKVRPFEEEELLLVRERGRFLTALAMSIAAMGLAGYPLDSPWFWLCAFSIASLVAFSFVVIVRMLGSLPARASRRSPVIGPSVGGGRGGLLRLAGVVAARCGQGEDRRCQDQGLAAEHQGVSVASRAKRNGAASAASVRVSTSFIGRQRRVRSPVVRPRLRERPRRRAKAERSRARARTRTRTRGDRRCPAQLPPIRRLRPPLSRIA